VRSKRPENDGWAIIAVSSAPVRCMREVAGALRTGGHAVIFDSFVTDQAEIATGMRFLRAMISFLGAEIMWRLAPILAWAGLRRSTRNPPASAASTTSLCAKSRQPHDGLHKVSIPCRPRELATHRSD
jgi:hypothetical protein